MLSKATLNPGYYVQKTPQPSPNLSNATISSSFTHALKLPSISTIYAYMRRNTCRKDVQKMSHFIHAFLHNKLQTNNLAIKHKNVRVATPRPNTNKKYHVNNYTTTPSSLAL